MTASADPTKREEPRYRCADCGRPLNDDEAKLRAVPDLLAFDLVCKSGCEA